MNRLKLGKEALVLSILTLITVLTWIGFQVYWTLNKSTILELTKKQMEPLNPKIKKTVIEDLQNKLSFSEEELNVVSVPTGTQSGILR